MSEKLTTQRKKTYKRTRLQGEDLSKEDRHVENVVSAQESLHIKMIHVVLCYTIRK